MSSKREVFVDWLQEALGSLGGSGAVADVCKHIWKRHETELRSLGDLFYTWQYDVRWAANKLRRSGVMKPKDLSPRGVWELARSKRGN